MTTDQTLKIKIKSIVHVSQPVEAGVAKVVSQLAALQSAEGFDVTVVSPKGWLADRAVEAGVRHIEWDASRQPGRAVADETRRLDVILHSLTPDLVHLHSSKAGLAGRLAIRGRVPTVFQPHAWSFEASDGGLRSAALSWERLASRWTDLTVCCSENERLVGVASGIRGMSLSVGNGTDPAEFPRPAEGDRRAARNRLGLASEAPLAVCVGRLQPQKGQETAIEAWQQVRRRVPDARLLLVGGGPDESRLRAMAGDGVRLAGPTDNPRDYLLAADLCVLPSRWEGLSLALLEGMACARSTVATDVSGSRELLLDGESAGAVVGVGQPAELAAAVVRRLRDPQLARTEGFVARTRIERGYTTASVSQRLGVGYGLVWRLRSKHQLRRTKADQLQSV